jgi:aspartate dehydrogenase
MRISVIGVGSIGRYLVEKVHAGAVGGVSMASVAATSGTSSRLVELAARTGCRAAADPLDVLTDKPDLVVEAASQAVVRQYAVSLLNGGADLMVMSVGALADAALLQAISTAAGCSGRRVHVPAGAIGGLDVVRAANLDQLFEVTLITSKPPRALAGAPFFETNPVDLSAIRERTVIFDGSAAEAVRLFPANVNVAAALSLAGIGPDRTRMHVVADPTLDRNIHEIHAHGTFGDLTVRVSNVPNPTNPKTSYLASLSALATLRGLSNPIKIG